MGWEVGYRKKWDGIGHRMGFRDGIYMMGCGMGWDMGWNVGWDGI